MDITGSGSHNVEMVDTDFSGVIGYDGDILAPGDGAASFENPMYDEVVSTF